MQVDEIEIKLLAEAIYLRYGYDFRDYAEASLMRRVKAILQKSGVGSISQLQHELLHKDGFFAATLPAFTITTSEMFRDPAFFRRLRDTVFPVLRTYPSLKIWHAGCSTGEEVFSLAISLKEEGLYERSTIYATDVNALALKAAKTGIYALTDLQAFTANYHAAGGTGIFSDYFTTGYGSARFAPELLANVVFSEHNLATDEVFSEMNLILCRNVLIYFKRPLQERVVDLFLRSLAFKGFLGLGSKETVQFLPSAPAFKVVAHGEPIFQKIGSSPSTFFQHGGSP